MIDEDTKDEYIVAKCGRCGAVWALDFEPDACTCDEFIEHPDDELVSVAATSYRQAVKIFMSPIGFVHPASENVEEPT